MRQPRKPKFFRRLLRLVVIAIFAFVVGVVIFAARCRSMPVAFQPTPESARHRPETAGIDGYFRAEDDTFLTYPEWFIVWSYQEKADYQQQHLPSGFPFFRSIAQYWRGYCCSYRVVRGKYAFNTGDHLMLAVIGTSFSVEYGLKGIYESYPRQAGGVDRGAPGHRGGRLRLPGSAPICRLRAHPAVLRVPLRTEPSRPLERHTPSGTPRPPQMGA